MTKNRHELPRKKPGRSAKDEIAEELPTLEPVVDDLPTLPPADDELPTLEAIDDAAPAALVETGPVKTSLAASTDAAFDTVVTVDVPAMDKKAVPDAFRAPLQQRLASAPGQLRHRRVLVRFTGDAVVGSAGKEVVAELLKPHLPLLAVVRRGFGDESVAQGKLPVVTLASSETGGVTRIEVGTADIEPIDLPLALASHLPSLLGGARGKRITFVFQGQGQARRGAARSARQAAAGRRRGALRDRRAGAVRRRTGAARAVHDRG